MALFGSKKKKVEKAELVAAKKVAATEAAHSFDISTIIRSPRVTEKASRVGEHNVYVFNISPSASKQAVAFAVKARYNVEPLRVRTLSIKAKQVISRGKKGTVGGGKKAYVYLKPGQTIQLT
jgi:large subunit ribosomal protein L23